MAWFTAGLLLVALFGIIQSIIYAGELRRSYERNITPHLAWQDPQSGQRHENEDFTGLFDFVVRSVGPGDARLHFAEARTSNGDLFPIGDIVTPATLPVNADYQWQVKLPKLDVRLLTGKEDKEMRITLKYADLQGRKFYETYATFAADSATLSTLKRAFKEVDERPADKRVTMWRPRGWSK